MGDGEHSRGVAFTTGAGLDFGVVDRLLDGKNLARACESAEDVNGLIVDVCTLSSVRV